MYMYILENPNTAAITLNHDLNFISTWSDDWLVKAAKTLLMILTLKRNPPQHPPLFMNGTPITITLGGGG